ncbi:MAG: glycosyltransferase [Verrucomicrobia bacterium]|nr:glycosyltransferase [Verrucomicrobiota bacterium]
MIVKDESAVIRRCLESVKPLIDTWIISDTGSTDGTQEIIHECLAGIPGKLHQRPWVNPAYNRNEAIDLAQEKGDYLLFIDADDQLILSQGFKKPLLDQDGYLVPYHRESCVLGRVLMVKSQLQWRWVGVAHEEILCPDARPAVLLPDAHILSGQDGRRSQNSDKSLRDAKVLEKLLQKEPKNSRYIFHLALAYEDAKEYRLALKNFEKRTALGGLEEEVFFSLFRKGAIQELLGYELKTIVESYKRAYRYRPTRAEPLFLLAKLYFTQKEYPQAYELFREAAAIPYPNDVINVIPAIYEYEALLGWAESAYYLGKLEETVVLYRKALQSSKLPSTTRNSLEKNLRYLQTKNF